MANAKLTVVSAAVDVRRHDRISDPFSDISINDRAKTLGIPPKIKLCRRNNYAIISSRMNKNAVGN
jgi:hypothetical protein